MERGDFEPWIKHIIGDDKLAKQITEINQSKKKLEGEALRKKLLTITKRRIKQLKRITKNPIRFVEKTKKG